jgi:hypothetical protein
VKALDASTTLELLMGRLDRQKCSMDSAAAVAGIVDRQLRLEGTLTLHSETAKKNGGDYDFDWICAVEWTRFPLFVEDRFGHTPCGENTKNKQSKKESPWWNLPQVAYSAKGNAIGAITDLKTSCLAAGRPDLANRCAIELQKALDQLKWGVEPNREEIGKIRQEVGTAPWLKLKRIRRVSDLPLQIPIAPTDRIGALYNHVRKELYEFFADVRPLEDFRGAMRRRLRPRHAERGGRDFDGVRREHRLARREAPGLRRRTGGRSIEARCLPDLEGRRFEGGCQRAKSIGSEAQSGPGRPSLL